MPIKEAVLAWVFVLVLPELFGLLVARFALSHGIGKPHVIGLASMVIASTRLPLIVYTARAFKVEAASLIYKPLPGIPQMILLAVFIVAVAVIDYLATTIISNGSYKPQLAEYKYYASHGILHLFPFQLIYYFTEITTVNLMYLLAKRSWTLLSSPIIAGISFVILTWALPHAFTKGVKVAIYASILAILLYTGYEATGSPLTPIILWFTVLLV